MDQEQSIQVAIIEDDQDIRDQLVVLINAAKGISCQQAYYSIEQAEPFLRADPPDLILMDIHLPGIDGIEGVKRLKDIGSEFIMLTVHQEDDTVFEALCAGACGYLTKVTPLPRIVQAIREAYAGGAPMSTQIARLVVNSFQKKKTTSLSRREKEVLTELCKGKSYKMVAETLFISTDTVRSHVRHIYKKLEVHSQSAAVAKALRERLI